MRAFEMMTSPVVTAPPTLPLNEAAQLLGEHSINTLPVVDDDGYLLGVVSETDVFRALALRLGIGLSPTARLDDQHTPRRVGDIMRPAATSVRRSDTVAMCLTAIARNDGEAIPVLESRRVVGIITRREALTALARIDPDLIDRSVVQGRLPGAPELLGAR